LGAFDRALEPSDIAQLNWNLLREDLSLPSAVLYEDKLLHNLNWMRQFISAYGVKLAPHGKTTMAPRLFDLQLQAGAWGITLATAHQTQVAYAHGVRRVLMANQLGWQTEHGHHRGPAARSRVRVLLPRRFGRAD
jgi:D-serine dehydratase